MKIFIEIIKSVLIIGILTILTQVGGLIYLVYKPIGIHIKKRNSNKYKSHLIRILTFSGLMIIFSLTIIPLIANQFGRVSLPIKSSKEIPLKPANLLLVIGNRHYVKPEMKQLIIEVSQQINKKYPKTKITYLDANFPFIDDFPLLPHRSHDDGEKLDIGFLYKNSNTGKRINKLPTILGYGYSEQPRKGEYDQIKKCEEQGYWQYGFMSKITKEKKRYEFDEEANKYLISQIIRDKRTGKIFIEPHLKTRLGFSVQNKVRFHGCKSVRHDDHIHLQL